MEETKTKINEEELKEVSGGKRTLRPDTVVQEGVQHVLDKVTCQLDRTVGLFDVVINAPDDFE